MSAARREYWFKAASSLDSRLLTFRRVLSQAMLPQGKCGIHAHVRYESCHAIRWTQGSYLIDCGLVLGILRTAARYI